MSKEKHAALAAFWIVLAVLCFWGNVAFCGGIFLIVALAQGAIAYSKFQRDAGYRQTATTASAAPFPSATPPKTSPGSSRFYLPKPIDR